MRPDDSTSDPKRLDTLVLLVILGLLFAVAIIPQDLFVARIGADVTREEAERDPNAALARLSSYGGNTPGASSAHPSSVTGEILAVDWEARTLTLEVHRRFSRPAGVMEGLHVELGFDVYQKAEVEAALAAGGEWYVQYFDSPGPSTFSIYALSPAKDYDSSPATDGGME